MADRVSDVSQRAPRWLAWTAALVLVPMSFLGGLLLGQDRLRGVTVAPAAVVVPASEFDLTDQRRTVAELVWDTGAPLRAPAWSGLVTAVHVGAGEELRTGDPIVSIDGIARLGAAMQEPFYRPLAAGDRGDDVEALHNLLVGAGVLGEIPAEASHFGSATVAAVRELERHIGIGQPTGVFDPSWVVWLPVDPFVVTEVAVEAGLPAPSLGGTVATGPPTLVGAVLHNADRGPLDLDADLEWTAELNGVHVGVDPISNQVVARDLTGLAGVVLAGAETITGAVRRAEGLTVLAVPTTAVVTAPDGRLCVWTPDSSGFTAVDVEVVGALAGVTHLRPNASVGEVLANPTAVLAEPACP